VFRHALPEVSIFLPGSFIRGGGWSRFGGSLQTGFDGFNGQLLYLFVVLLGLGALEGGQRGPRVGCRQAARADDD
jgi:hypothetical protein